MSSKTSFFNKTVFLKNMRQFWPLWGTYLGILLLTAPLVLYNYYNVIPDVSVYQLREWVLNSAANLGLAFAFVFSVCSAVAMFSFLYSIKSAGFYSGLPMRRSGLFFTQFMSGLIWLIGSNLITALMLLLVEASCGKAYFDVTFQWFLIMSGYCLFYYSFAVLCAVLTGHNMVTIPLFIVLNFFVVIVERLVKAIMSLLVFGYDFRGTILKFLSPPVYMQQFGVLSTYENGAVSSVTFSSWGALAAYAAVGVLFAFAAYMIFKRRHMESAGDVVAVNVLKPVFRVCMGLGGALCGGCLLYLLFPNLISGSPAAAISVYMLISAFIGFFAAEMLIAKSFKVFRRRRWAELSAIWAVILLFTVGMRTDLFGIKSYVPDAESVGAVNISCGYGYESSDTEVIERTTQLHRAILKYADYYESAEVDDYERYLADVYGVRLDADGVYGCSLSISYELKSGKTVSRSYTVHMSEAELSIEGSVAYQLDALMNSSDAIAQRLGLGYGFSSFGSKYASVDLIDEDGVRYSAELTTSQIEHLYTVLIPQDVAAGLIGRIDFVSAKSDVSYEPYRDYFNVVLNCDLMREDDSFVSISLDIYNTDSAVFRYLVDLYEQNEIVETEGSADIVIPA